MHNTPDGGPAFPQGTLDAKDGYAQTMAAAHCGLSLRDYFAAKALPETIRHALALRETQIAPGNFDFDRVALTAYEMADAMLRARSAQSPAEIMRAHLDTFGK